MKINLISMNFTNRLEVSEEVLKLVGEYMSDTNYSDKEHVEKAYIVSGEDKVHLKIEYDNTVVCKNVLLFLNVYTKALYLVNDDEVICKVLSRLGDLTEAYVRPIKFRLGDFQTSNISLYDHRKFSVLKVENEDFEGFAFKIDDNYFFPYAKTGVNKFKCSLVTSEELFKYNFSTIDACDVFLEEGEELLPLFNTNAFEFTSNKSMQSHIQMKDCELKVNRDDIIAIYNSGYKELLKLEDKMILVTRKYVMEAGKPIYIYKIVDEIPGDMVLKYERKEIIKSELSKKTNGAFSFFKY